MQWSSIMEAVQKVINHSPLKRSGRNSIGNMRCHMEVFTGPTLSPLLFRPTPMKTYRTLQAIGDERLRSVVNVGKLQKSFDGINKEKSSNSVRVHTKTQQLHNAQTSVLPVNIVVGDFVLVIVSAKQGHKLQRKWNEPMRVVEAKLHLLFVVKDINSSQKMRAHVQRLIPYPVSPKHEEASKKLYRQSAYYDTMSNIVEEI